jgi:hypothetical protein
MFILSKYADWGNLLESGRSRNSGKMVIRKKKGQVETCPYLQKEGKMKTFLYNTTKIYLVKQKSSRIYDSLPKTMAAGIRSGL